MCVAIRRRQRATRSFSATVATRGLATCVAARPHSAPCPAVTGFAAIVRQVMVALPHRRRPRRRPPPRRRRLLRHVRARHRPPLVGALLRRARRRRPAQPCQPRRKNAHAPATSSKWRTQSTH
jgi:hypothetical protein